MRSPKAARVAKRDSIQESIEVVQKELLDQAIQKQEALAESRLEMAKLFLQNRKPKIALRRLKEIISDFGESEAAKEAKTMLKKLSP